MPSRPLTGGRAPGRGRAAEARDQGVAPDAVAGLVRVQTVHEELRALAAGRPAPLTSAELTWAGRIAWRNHARCIGRLHWRSLQVRDHRELADPADLAASLREHLALAQGDGTVRSYLTVFSPEDPSAGAAPRIWNAQLCGYAGYRRADGSILGDPANEAFTRLAINLGWRPPAEP
ncbi:MAG: nitric oxide synthase oxygenase, partial [Gammaproteobacteria bacterium]|nr:nitric oxide synthase oxygenase [Gammaproteobacteria bacterium]